MNDSFAPGFILGIFVGCFLLFIMEGIVFSANEGQHSYACRKKCYPAQVDVCDPHLVQCAGNAEIKKVGNQHE